MAENWRTRDRIGREVIFTSQGRDHILDRHDEMAGHLGEVRAVIEQATTVTRDLDYRHRENHYHRASSGGKWIKVIVQYRPVPPQGTWQGEIVTAYFVRRPDPREEPRSL